MLTIRRAVPSDESALGRYGAALMRQHHAADPRRFILTEHPEKGYGRFLAAMLGNSEFLVLAAEDDGAVIGYLLAGIEPVSWRDLRGPCGYVHDVYVDPATRRRGVGRALMSEALAWIRSKGQSQVVLTTMWANEAAQRLFESVGFRRTMVEMTRDEEANG